MAKFIKELTLDVVRDNICGTVSAKQNDIDSRFIKAKITAERKEIKISPMSTVVINALRSDGESSGFAGTVNQDGTVNVPITSWMLSLSGSVKCDISVYDGNEKLTTMPFFISVEENLYNGEGVEDTEEFGVLWALISDVQNMKSEELERQQAEELRISAEEERIAAESQRTTFLPSVSEEGIISWTNDKGLENPVSVSIRGDDGYTPIRGTDYWTDADKSEIISEVLNSLPYAEGGVF